MPKIQVEANQCAICGYIWLPSGKDPAQCPHADCRSRKWNGQSVNKPAGGGLRYGSLVEMPAELVPDRPKPTLESLRAMVGKIEAKPMEAASSEPEQPMCHYKEYDSERGDWFACGLRVHHPKIKHTRGQNLGTL